MKPFRRTSLNVPLNCPLPKCRANRPLLLPFPAERKREGPRGLSAFQFFFPCSGNQKSKCNGEILRNCSDTTISCDAGIADATSFSLLDAKRTKQEKHAWGSVPHDPRARHFGSGQLRGTFKLVRRKGFKLTASRRFRHEAFSFPRCARKSPHEPRPQFGAMLPWPIIT